MWRYGLLAMLGVVAMAVAACDGVNGDVTATESGAGTVNGSITLKTAHVGGGLSTVGGDIDLSGESRVEGGILVQEPGGWFGGSSSRARKPRIVIGPGAVVQGNLRFEREVELYVSERATV